MSNKKPIGNVLVNQQEIQSIYIDTDNEIIVVVVKVYLEEADTPELGQSSISNVSIVRKTFTFSDIPNINGIITSIDNKI